MDFLRKIKKKILSKKNKEPTFYEQIQQEKKKKYLFRADEDDVYVARRWIRKTILGREKRINTNPEYTNFFQKSIDKIAYNGDLRHIMGLVGFFLIALIIYIVAFSPYFKISPSKVVIESLNDGIDTSLVGRAAEVAYGKSIFTLDEEAIAKNIQKNLQNTEHIRIDRLFPNGIKILIKSLPNQSDATIFGVENKRFGLSSNGVLIPIADISNPEFKRHLQFISLDLQSELFFGYKKVVSDRTMLVISKIFELFEKEWTDLPIVQANYFSVERELHLILESNTKIIFALQAEAWVNSETFSNNLLGQLVTLQTYMSENRAKLSDGSLTYLDVRIPWKVFACVEPANCKQNLISVYGKVYEN